MPSEFEFEEGDRVLIRVRDGGRLRAKFLAECSMIEDGPPLLSPTARFDFGYGFMKTLTFRPNEAEFEVVDDPDEVSF